MRGLSGDEARRRQLLYGFNELDQISRVVWWRIVLSQFSSPLILVLVAAGFFTFLIGDFLDTAVILVAVLVNGVLGFVQEYKAEKAIESLQKLLDPRAKVWRDGEWVEIDAREVVVGDLVRLEIGQTVPADGILVHEDGMFVNESILTGESVNVEKMDFTGEVRTDGQWYEKMPSKYKVFMGTSVSVGIGEAVVCRIGQQTRFGAIAGEVGVQKEEDTPLQKKIRKLSLGLSLMVCVVASLVFAGGVLSGDGIKEMFPAAVALAVSAVPEGLLVSLTLILAVGMRRILKRKAVVRRLVSAETLGGVDVICLDKTGTITVGQMRPIGPVVSLKVDFFDQTKRLAKISPNSWQRIVAGCLLCNDDRDPLEIGMRQWARGQLGIKGYKAFVEQYERVDGMPFDPKTRFIATLSRNKKNGQGLVYVSGAPEVCLEFCSMSAADKTGWHEMFSWIGAKGYRMVAFGYRSIASKYARGKISKGVLRDMIWAGLICFEDPVRESVRTGLVRALKAGIGVKVITGDYKETAWSVLAKLGLVPVAFDKERVVTGEEIEKALSGGINQIFEDKVEKVVLFARTTPGQKRWIVEALQDKGHVVAMTGDGVNDAPALKRADIGIVVNQASDVAKETGDLVLLDNNFNTILSAIEEGRAIMDNLRKVIVYLMADSFAAVVLMLLAIATGVPLPLSASQILWGNLISDGFPYIALAFEPKEKGILRRKPDRGGGRLVEPFGMILMIVISLVCGVLAYGVFWTYWAYLESGLSYARTMTYLMLGTTTLLSAFSLRVLDVNVWRTSLAENKLLLLSVLLGFGMMYGIILVPQLSVVFGMVIPGVADILLVFVLALGVMGLVELCKSIRLMRSR